MKYLSKKSYESFEELFKDYSKIETQLMYICKNDKQLDECLSNLKEEAKQIMEL